MIWRMKAYADILAAQIWQQLMFNPVIYSSILTNFTQFELDIYNKFMNGLNVAGHHDPDRGHAHVGEIREFSGWRWLGDAGSSLWQPPWSRGGRHHENRGHLITTWWRPPQPHTLTGDPCDVVKDVIMCFQWGRSIFPTARLDFSRSQTESATSRSLALL